MKKQRVTKNSNSLIKSIPILFFLAVLFGSIYLENHIFPEEREYSKPIQQVPIRKDLGKLVSQSPNLGLSSNGNEVQTQIVINSNSDFVDQASKRGWSGNGTQFCPFQIDGFKIKNNGDFINKASEISWSGNDIKLNRFKIDENIINEHNILIDIKNTDVHFQLSNCLLFKGTGGIYLNNVTNGRISNNLILSKHSSGIHLYNSGDIIIANNSVINSIDGLSLRKSTNIIISNNSISNNMNGITLSSSSNNTLFGNYISNSRDNGIHLSFSGNNTIIDNRLENNGVTITGSRVSHFLQSKVTNNIVNGDPLVYWKNLIGGEVPSDAGQIIIVNSTDITVTDQHLDNTTVGVIAAYCVNLSIHNNRFTHNNKSGILLYSSSNSTISDNAISDCNYAIELHSSRILSVSKNSVNNNINGIYLSSSTKIIISDNLVFNNTNGIFLSSSDTNIIFKNVIYNNVNGLQFVHSRMNTLSGNTIYNNIKNGLLLSFSGNNTILDNHLVNNGLFINGSQLDHFLQAEMMNNLINGNPLVYLVNINDSEVPSEAGQVIIVNSTAVNITSQYIEKTSVGILVAFCTNLVINTNTLSSNSQSGIFLYNSTNNTISNNNIINNDVGISLYYSTNNTVVNNDFINNGFYVVGDIIQHYFQSEVRNNRINGKGVIYWQNVKGAVVPNDIAQIILINCSDVIVKNQTLKDVNIGIFATFSSNLSIRESFISYCYEGIRFVESVNCTISRNTVVNNSNKGIFLLSSHNNFITTNSISYNTFSGCVLSGSNKNTISFNSIYHNRINGIDLWFSNETTIKKNIISDNGMYGINLNLSSNNIIIQNNFIGNNLEKGSQANDHDNKGQGNFISLNYWSDWRSPDINDDGIVDTRYTIDGSFNWDPYPQVNPYHIEIYLLSTPGIFYPNGGEILQGNVLIEWKASFGERNQDIYYTILCTSDQFSWILVASGLTDTSYVWNTSLIPNGFNYILAVIAYDSEGLKAIDLSDGPFTIENVSYHGITLLKILIAVNLFMFAAFLLTLSYHPLRGLYQLNKTKGLSRDFFIDFLQKDFLNSVKRSKWVLLTLCVALIFSLLRAWLVDPVIVINDGYDNYAYHIKILLFNWTHEVDRISVIKHKFRIIYPLLVAIFSIIVPQFDIILIGRFISISSFFISIYYFSKILERFKALSHSLNKERILIVFILSPTMITNFVRFETDILFLALTLYIIYHYLIFVANESGNLIVVKLLLAIGILFFIREVGAILIIALILHQFLSLRPKYKFITIILLTVLILGGFWFNILQDFLFYAIWNASTYSVAEEILHNNNWYAIFDILEEKLTNAYVFNKTVESLAYAFFPSVIFCLLGCIRLFRIRDITTRKKVLFNIISIYFLTFLIFYMLLKVGRGLDRFWIPIIPFPLLFLAFTIDLDELKLDLEKLMTESLLLLRQIYLEKIKKDLITSSYLRSTTQVRIASSFAEMTNSMLILDDRSMPIFPKTTYYAIVGIQLLIFYLRIHLPLSL